MTVAQDILAPAAAVGINEPTVFAHDGKLDATYSVRNMYARIQYPFNADVSTMQKRFFLYGATTPQGDATYGSAPIGTEFDLFTISSNVVTEYKKYIKQYSGNYGWCAVFAGSTSTSLQVTGTSVRMMQARVDFSTASCDNFVAYFRAKCSGGSQMVGVVRGYAESAANNSSICGGDFTGEIIAGGATHSNGHVSGVHAMCAVASGLTISGGALSSLLLTANLASAVTGLQQGGAAFIFLTDQNATYKVKYLIDAHSDGSSLIDTGTGTSHLECYESDGMTFTCKGGYRIYTAAGAELYIPFGTLAS